MGDLPFKVYFNFGTTTGDRVFNDKKKFTLTATVKCITSTQD